MNVVTSSTLGVRGGAGAAADQEELPGRGAAQVGEHAAVALVDLPVCHLGVALRARARARARRRRTPSTIPTWSEWAWVRITASMSLTLRPRERRYVVELRAEPGQAAVDQRQLGCPPRSGSS